MIKMYKELKSTRKVGNFFGISKVTVSKILKQNNVFITTIQKDNNEIERMIALYKKYGSVKKVSELTGFKMETVNKYIADIKKEYYRPYVYENKYSYNENIFDEINTEEKAYWLGFLYADGCVRDSKGYPCNVSIGLQLNDENHLYKFAEFLGGEKDMVKVNHSKKRCDINIANKHMANTLIELGCTPRKSLTLKPPTATQVPLGLKRHFIRGFFDGDGTIYKRKTRESYCFGFVGTPQMINWISNYFYENTQCKPIKNSIINDYTWEWKKEGKSALECAKHIYQDSTIYLDRKFEIICPFME